jgi:dipeptidyl aminopeptidase/acylaminoacyl peptidase
MMTGLREQRRIPMRPIALALCLAAPVAPRLAADDGRLTLDALVAIRHPSQARWSPDGRRVAFVWDRAAVQDVFVVDAAGGEPRALTRHEDGLLQGLFWSPDGTSVYFEREGDLWRVGLDSAAPERVWQTPEGESDVTLAPDGLRVAFVRRGDLWLRSLRDGAETRLTDAPGDEAGPVWSPDGARLAFTTLTLKSSEQVPPYVGFKIAFRETSDYATRVGVIAAAGGPAQRLAEGEGLENSPGWLDAQRVVLQRETRDLKTRELAVADVRSGEFKVIFRESDPKWWSLTYLGAEPVPAPDGRQVAIISDADGWDHLYLVPAAGGPPLQVTRGRYEVSRPAWSPDGRRIAFDTNEGPNPGARRLVVAELGSPRPRLTPITGGRGVDIGPAWSPDGAQLLYQRSAPRSPAELHVVAARAGSAPVRLTDSLPAGVERAALVEPQLVRYPSADGQSVPAYLFVPPGLPSSARHPAIVWVHGDGITQNFDGWHTRRDYAVYYSFHQYLVQRGYVVLAVDYRGSIGYGRDWRQGHYRDLGGKDYEDIAAGVGYLKTLGYVDAERVGVWGLSYGGFMALQAVTVTPELFRCAIDVAGVPDWRDWARDPDGPWIRGRMGTPDENAELYDRTSPIHRMERLVRPLLVMHGTADVNVPFLESVRLMDVVQKLGKDVEFVMYPGEFHYFHRAHVLRDAWSRAERFFDRHLRDRP